MSLVIFLFSLLPAIFWLTWYYRQDAKYPEPGILLWLSFLAGGLVALSILTWNAWTAESGWALADWEPKNLSVLIVVIAILEETLKAGATWLIIRKNLPYVDQIIDGIIYAVSVAIGFAVVENFVYFIKYYSLLERGEILGLYFYRSLVTMLSHSLFSGIFGYFLGQAILAKKTGNTPVRPRWKHVFFFKNIRAFFHQKSMLELSQVGIVIEGLFLAITLHFVFNALLSLSFGGYSLSFLALPFVLVTGGWMYYKLHEKEVTAVKKTD